MVRQNPRSRPQTLDRPPIPDARRSPSSALADASCEVSGGRSTVVLAAPFAASPADLWALVSEPTKLERWAPFTSDRPLSLIGRATLSMLDGTADSPKIACVVFVADEPRGAGGNGLLEFSWAADTVAWTIAVVDESISLLTLRQTLADASTASAVAAGWHLCLEVAAGVLEGRPVHPVRGADALHHGWGELNERYAAKLGVEPTPAPIIATATADVQARRLGRAQG
jgi:hypothetical protein